MPEQTAKPIYLSKTVIVAVIGIVCALLQSRYGWQLVDADVQMTIFAVVMLLLRIVTDGRVKVVPGKAPARPADGHQTPPAP